MTEPTVEQNIVAAEYTAFFNTTVGADEHVPVLTKQLAARQAELVAAGESPAKAYIVAKSELPHAMRELKGAVELQTYRVEAEARFIKAGGTADEFKKDWPVLRSEYLRKAAGGRSGLSHEEKLARTVKTW